MKLWIKLYSHKIIELLIERKRIKGNKVISPIHKRKVVEKYGIENKCNILIETGTYLGEMIEYQQKNFNKIFSIEIAEVFFEFSRKRLMKYKNIEILQGDSGTMLASILSHVSEDDKILFWLDGHYSGGLTEKGSKDCPIFEELDCIFATKRTRDVILIDDARCFDGQHTSYPTVEELKSFILEHAPESNFEVTEDIVRIVM